MPRSKRNDESCQEVDPLIPIMNLVCMLILCAFAWAILVAVVSLVF